MLRPLVARMFGLAELRLTTGGTEHTSVKLRYLPSDTAQSSSRGAARACGGLGPGVAEAPERPLVVVSPGALIGSTLLDLVSARGLFLFVGTGRCRPDRLQAARDRRRQSQVGVVTFVPVSRSSWGAISGDA